MKKQIITRMKSNIREGIITSIGHYNRMTKERMHKYWNFFDNEDKTYYKLDFFCKEPSENDMERYEQVYEINGLNYNARLVLRSVHFGNEYSEAKYCVIKISPATTGTYSAIITEEEEGE